jgi:hypothetical protein
VIEVDINNFTVTVAVEFVNKVLTGVAYASPYHHFNNGEGMYAMPEVGSLCWICEPSDGARPFIIGWAPAYSNSGYRSNRKSLNPGDIYLGTRDENFLILRRGGVVQIGGGPLSQRLFLPVQNTIRDICENYSLESLAGSLEWIVDRQETTTDGKRPSRLKIKVRDKTSDKGYIAALQIGSHEDDSAFSLVVNSSGEEGASTAVSLKLNKDGSIEWKATSGLTLSLDGDLDIEAVGQVSIKAGGSMSLESSADLNVKGAQVEISFDSTT